jgi:hypothetical protein
MLIDSRSRVWPGMTRHFAQGLEIPACLKEVRGKGVSQVLGSILRCMPARAMVAYHALFILCIGFPSYPMMGPETNF